MRTLWHGKFFPHYWPFVPGSYRSTVDSHLREPAKMFSLLLTKQAVTQTIGLVVNANAISPVRCHCNNSQVVYRNMGSKGLVQYWDIRKSSWTQISRNVFVRKIRFRCLIILKFCTKHDGDTSVHYAELKMIGKLLNKLWANEISRDFDLECVSGGHHTLHRPSCTLRYTDILSHVYASGRVVSSFCYRTASMLCQFWRVRWILFPMIVRSLRCVPYAEYITALTSCSALCMLLPLIIIIIQVYSLALKT